MVVVVNAKVGQKIAQTGDIRRHVRGVATRPPGDLGPDRRDPTPRCFGVERSGAVGNTPEASKTEMPGSLFRGLTTSPGDVAEAGHRGEGDVSAPAVEIGEEIIGTDVALYQANQVMRQALSHGAPGVAGEDASQVEPIHLAGVDLVLAA